MLQKTLTQMQDDLQGLLDEVGVDAFPRTKALYLKDVQLLDADGNEIDPDSVDLEIALEPVETTALDEEEEKQLDDEDEESKQEEEDEETETKAADDEEDDAPAEKPRRRLRIGLGSKPGNRVGQAADLRNPRSGELTPRTRNLDKAVTKAVAKALNTTNVRSKGNDMRIDNDREGLVRWGSLKHINRVRDLADPELEAYKFGRWAAACMGHRKSMDWCSSRGIETKAHLETVNSQGGFLVPDEFSNTLISLREEYGVFRRNAKIEPMTSDTKRVPKRSATLTASFIGEAATGTETTQTFQQVSLVAKKLMVLTTISNELNEDSLINLGDSVAGEVAYAFALKEDQCGFMGTGASTFGGIVGIINAINNVSSNIGITQLGTGDRYAASVDIGDFHTMMGTLPNYADSPNCKFYMHKGLWNGMCEKLIYGVGGTSAREASEGVRGLTFLGYPVELTQVMPDISTGASGADGEATDETYRYPVIFGDLSMAASFGDRRDNTMAFSDSALNAFEQDEIVVRGTERFDINCHSPGTTTVAGPVVGMKLD